MLGRLVVRRRHATEGADGGGASGMHLGPESAMVGVFGSVDKTGRRTGRPPYETRDVAPPLNADVGRADGLEVRRTKRGALPRR